MRATVVAPIVAAILGIAGGVATALVVPDEGGPSASTFNDPLHLGIPLVDQDCTGEALLVVGYGSNVAPLGSAVANNGTDGVRYLRSDDSCPTILGPEGEDTPAYVVYLGPFDTPTKPCELRMTPEHRGDFVTVLRSGNNTLVKCPCVLPTSAAPDLRVGMTATQEDAVWIRALQAMLTDYDPEKFPHGRISGQYTQETADRVAEVQQEAPGVLTEPGVVDQATWRILTDRICRIYEF